MFNMVPFRSHDDHMMKRGDSFDKMLDSFWTHPFGSMLQNLGASFESFKVDVKDKGDAYELAAELPGIKKEDISIDYRDNYLTVSAEHKEEKKTDEQDGRYLCRERSYGAIKRSFYIDNVDRTKINASFEDGVLKINLPKSKETEAEHRIEIR